MEDGVALETGDYAVSVVELVYKNAFEAQCSGPSAESRACNNGGCSGMGD